MEIYAVETSLFKPRLFETEEKAISYAKSVYPLSTETGYQDKDNTTVFKQHGILKALVRMYIVE